MAADRHANAPMAEYWNGAGGTNWTATQASHARQLAPWGELLVTAVAPRTGEAILDVGCGCGEVTTDLARATGRGRTAGVDISETMLTTARQLAAAAGVDISFRNLDAQTDPLGGPYDAVVSRFGVMFFDDPTAAFANLRSATRAGGRLVFVCWQALDHNPWTDAPVRAGAAVVDGFEVPDPAAPGPWALSDPDRVRIVLTDAGWEAISLEAVELPMTLGTTIDAAAEYFLTSSAGQRLVAAAAGDAGRAAVKAAAAEALSAYVGPLGVTPPGRGWLVQAHNP